MFSNYFQPLSQNVSIKDQFPGVEDRYNIYFTKGIYFLLLLWKELLFIHTTGCMFVFYKKEILLLLFVQLRESPGILSKILEKSWKVLEFESIFLVGNMEYQIHTKLVWITFAGIDRLHLWEELHYWA